MALVLSIVAALSLVLTLGLHLCVRVLLRRPLVTPVALPPVSVLKPLKGLDDGLGQNLASLVEQDYPEFQVVFGVADPDDPALAIARRLQRDHPQRDIRIVTAAPLLGRNPKVSNLASLCREARHDLWLVSDSNVRARPTYLRETVAALQPGIGVVTNLFVGVHERTLGAWLENLHLSTWVVSGIAAAPIVTGRAAVVGKSMLFTRDVLQQLGGWEEFGDILAEDYVIGQRVEELGLRAGISAHVIESVNTSWPLARFLNRHLRWAQIRRWLSLPRYLGEALLYPVVWLLLLALAGEPWWALLGLAVKSTSDQLLARRLRGRGFGWRGVLLIPPKDLTMAGIWLIGLFRRRIWWRGNRLWIGPGTELLAERG